MRNFFLIAPLGLLALLVPGNAQTMDRRADIVGGGGQDSGKCTIEVVVDGSAEIQVRGTTATMRNLSGQAPQWRRFQCTGQMPQGVGVQFVGVDGRGRQTLVSDPRGTGGVAIVRIDDPDGGSEGYTFDLIWGNNSGVLSDSQRRGGPGFNQPGGGYNQQGDRGFGDDRGFGGPRDRSFTTDQAIQVCKDSIQQEARERFGPANVIFRQTNIDNNRGRNDWVVGTIAINTSRWRPSQVYRFSCSVDFATGRVRTAHIGVPNY